MSQHNKAQRHTDSHKAGGAALAIDYIPLLSELMGIERFSSQIYQAQLVGEVNGWVYEVTAQFDVQMHQTLNGVFARYKLSANDEYYQAGSGN